MLFSDKKSTFFWGGAQLLLRWHPMSDCTPKISEVSQGELLSYPSNRFRPITVMHCPQIFPQVFAHGRRPMGRFWGWCGVCSSVRICRPANFRRDLILQSDEKTSFVSFRPQHPGQFCSEPLSLGIVTDYWLLKNQNRTLAAIAICCFDDTCIQ